LKKRSKQEETKQILYLKCGFNVKLIEYLKFMKKFLKKTKIKKHELIIKNKPIMFLNNVIKKVHIDTITISKEFRYFMVNLF